MTPVYAVLLLGAYFVFATLVAFCRWAARRIAQLDAAEQQRIEDIETRAAIPAAPDNTEGVNRSDWDDCELILAATREVEAGWQRLINDLRKEEQ